MRHAIHPIRIPEQQFFQIHNAAAWLCQADREQFVSAVHAELVGQELGAGAVGRACDVTQFPFPSYTFVGIELQWHTARWAPGVIRLVMSGGDEPAKVPAAVIDRIRSQERDGYVVLPNATLWLCPPDRDQFWTLIADELRQVAEPGEGVVCRVIASAFLRLFRGFDVPDEPNLLGKLDHGHRYEAKLDAIEAHRTCRERSDAR